MSKRRNEIMPECFVDTTLISILLGSDVNHKKGCPSVAKEMQGGRSADGFSVGVVDNDKRKLAYFEQFVLIAENPLLHLFHHPEKPQYLIKIGGEKEAMESFILACANETGIDLSNYGLKHNLESLKEKTKSISSTQIVLTTDLGLCCKKSAVTHKPLPIDFMRQIISVLCYL